MDTVDGSGSSSVDGQSTMSSSERCGASLRVLATTQLLGSHLRVAPAHTDHGGAVGDVLRPLSQLAGSLQARHAPIGRGLR